MPQPAPAPTAWSCTPSPTPTPTDPEAAVAPYIEAARAAHSAGVGVNAGHDLNLENLAYFAQHMPYLDEVSIGHALICDALYLGLEEAIRQYRNQLT